jgi:hypothetical protein
MKLSKVIGLIAALSIATLMFTITGCQSKRQIRQTENGYPASTAEVISHATSGRIYSTDSIVLRFVNPVIPEEQVGEKVEKQVFFFDPDIEGTASWKDRRTLVFKPAERLPFRRTFKGEARFNELIPQYEHLEPMIFKFSVPGRDLLNLEADFKLVNRYNPSLSRYGGTITFNEMIDIERLNKAVSFSEGRKNLPLEWQMKKENRVFTFISPEVKRKTKTRYFSLKIDKKTAQLSAEFDKVIELAPLKELKITAFRKFDQGEKPGIEIAFSDDLDPRQDKTGLVRVVRDRAVKTSEPHIETAIKTLKKSLYLEGNFTYGESFTIKISGIKSKWGTRLKQEYVKTFDFEDKKPELSFISSGVFLPSANQQKLGFKTINLKRVHLEVKKVFESNLGQFLQTEKISSRKRRNVQFNHQYVNRVGVSVARQTLKIGDIKNKWLTHQLDLKKLIKPGEKGLFLVRIYFDRAAMMYGGLDDKSRYYYGKEYYSNPNAYGYTHRHGSIYKPVVLSDIGLLVKQGANRRHTVFATDIIKAVPMNNVKITLRTFQNQVITTAFTDRNGKAVIDKVNQPVYYIEGEKNGQRSFIQPKEMAWNISSFDTGGEEDPGHATRAYIYTDRGVYRPGDEAHISLIARNWDNSFPDAHPVTMQIYNPKNQMIYKKTSSDGKDGFYSFLFKSKPEDMTGNWRAVFHAGSRSFSHTRNRGPLPVESQYRAGEKRVQPRR